MATSVWVLGIGPAALILEVCRKSRVIKPNAVNRRAGVARSKLYGDATLGSSVLRVQQSSSTFSSLLRSRKRRSLGFHAVADRITREFGEVEGSSRENPVIDTESAPADGKVDYNWEEQWYPMYLINEIPKDAPLALKVYDRDLVVFYDGEGKLNCLEDRCPHRLAKLSEGQLMDGTLECLYHGWQFAGDGSCVKIPQLEPGAKIPKKACARSYAVKESQGVLWAWMGDDRKAPYEKVPYYEAYDREGWWDYSAMHELPYDSSIMLENIMDPAHIPISHNRTDATAKREDAQALVFNVTVRDAEGFGGFSHNIRTPDRMTYTRFQAPCIAHSESKRVNDDGSVFYFNATMLCRPVGQGKSMNILRFSNASVGVKGKSKMSWFRKMPKWFVHANANTILEQDMGFLSSQNEVLLREGKPTKDLYLNLRSQDVWVLEYRKWLDKVGHGMPYYFGHRTASPPSISAVEEGARAGLAASIASTYPSKGAFGNKYARDPTNRYYRHIVHCKACREALGNFEKYQKVSLVGAAIFSAVGIIMSKPVWRASFVVFALFMGAASYAFSRAVRHMTENVVREHRITL